MKSLSLSNRVLLCMAATLMSLSASGCGNWNKSDVHTAAPGSYKTPSVSYTNVTGNGGYPGDTDYKCPTTKPSTVGGADAYTICQGVTSAFNLSVHGSPSRGKNQVCVFPVDAISASQAYANSDTNGGVLDQCVDMSAGYTTVSFTGARFNGAIVVEAADEDSMAWCLQNGNYSACPSYSYQRWGAYDTTNGK